MSQHRKSFKKLKNPYYFSCLCNIYFILVLNLYYSRLSALDYPFSLTRDTYLDNYAESRVRRQYPNTNATPTQMLIKGIIVRDCHREFVYRVFVQRGMLRIVPLRAILKRGFRNQGLRCRRVKPPPGSLGHLEKPNGLLQVRNCARGRGKLDIITRFFSGQDKNVDSHLVKNRYSN